VKEAPSVLTIVVPAWKPDDLDAALSSIAAQTDTRFECHVFDDAGPPAVAQIAARYPQFRYTRFERNLGGTSLAAQWNRCLEEVRTPWVWLFSDDDTMQPYCVAAFHAARERLPHCAVFQFAVDMVGPDLTPLLWRSVPPAHESAAQFLAARLEQRRLSCLPDHVFHLPTLRRQHGGLVEFPLAWNSDDASWLVLGAEHGIGGIPEATVAWRQSGRNVSDGSYRREDKLQADLVFVRWLQARPDLRETAARRMPRWLGTRLARVYGFRAADTPRLIAHLGPRLAARALPWFLAVRVRDARKPAVD
jgi:hypothetical protein